MSEGLAKYFVNGYRYVPLNPNEPVPSIDLWAISPNGLEQTTATDKPEHLRYLNFTRISNPNNCQYAIYPEDDFAKNFKFLRRHI